MPSRIIPWSAPALVREHRVVVIYVGSTPLTEQVFRFFEEHHGAATAWVDSDDVTFDAFSRDWLHARQRALGWLEIEFVPEGYYLFVDGEVRDYNAGMIDTSKDGLSMLFGAIAGLDALLSKKGKSFRQAIEYAHAQASLRVIAAFSGVVVREVMRRRFANAAAPPPPPPVPARDELLDAFDVLGLDSAATERELKRRYRELMSEHHPDRHAGEPDAALAANVRAQEINKAHSVICSRRGWGRNAANGEAA